MRNSLFLALIFIFTGCASVIGTHIAHPPSPYNEVYYRFEKGWFLSDRYYLTVVNHSDKMVDFFMAGKANFLTLEDGSTVPLYHPEGDTDFMNKQTFEVKPHESGSLSFDIPKDKMHAAVTITFKGQTESIKKEFINYWAPDRQIIVTYDVHTTEITAVDGDAIGAQSPYNTPGAH